MKVEFATRAQPLCAKDTERSYCRQTVNCTSRETKVQRSQVTSPRSNSNEKCHMIIWPFRAHLGMLTNMVASVILGPLTSRQRPVHFENRGGEGVKEVL